MIVKIDSVGSYNGHSVKSNGNVSLSFKFRYSELVNYIKLIQMLNNDVKVKVKKQQEKEFSLGVFRINSIKIDHDGEGNVSFTSMTDYAEVDNLNKLVMESKDEEFRVGFEADVEVENEDEEEWD